MEREPKKGCLVTVNILRFRYHILTFHFLELLSLRAKTYLKEEEKHFNSFVYNSRIILDLKQFQFIPFCVYFYLKVLRSF